MWKKWSRKKRWTIGVMLSALLWAGVHAPRPLDIIVRIPEGYQKEYVPDAWADYAAEQCVPFLTCMILPGVMHHSGWVTVYWGETQRPEVHVSEGGRVIQLTVNRRVPFSLGRNTLNTLILNYSRSDESQCKYDGSGQQGVSPTRVRYRARASQMLGELGYLSVTLGRGLWDPSEQGWRWPWQRTTLEIELTPD